MVKIPLNIYSTVKDYEMNKKPNYPNDISIYKNELITHAITLGNLSNYALTQAGIDYYTSFVHMFFDNNLKVRDDYIKSETTIKSELSFLMGMTLTKLVAAKVYNIPNLYHLKDSNYMTYTSKKNKKHPDFFGIDISGNAYLFEAKGRYKGRLSRTSLNNKPSGIKQVENQLLNIAVVTTQLKNNGVLNQYKNIRTHIVQSVFTPKFSSLY
ncbi:hypothetical protein ACVQ8P_08390 [Dellaglioa sp. BT-FLS60]